MTRKSDESGRPDYWRQKVDEFLASGLKRQEFCQRFGINPHKFGYWFTHLNRRNGKKVRPRGPFVQVLSPKAQNGNGSSSPATNEELRIHLPGGATISVTEGTSFELLSKILKMLEGSC